MADDDDTDRPGAAEARGGARPFADSLCWRCAHHRAIQAARSTFLMCGALPVKYPRQPVTACSAFRPAPQPRLP